ncbi:MULTISPECIES: DNA gyrase/topoisomerase IV subunit A [Spirosoma]|uniref:DNA gyrase/topoisomerase IV subunit A n=1 Tax=Spirosoma liriopis TaxID=2937440 RepID=A0ABT0HPF9_9BACT|nr:MULTISPECIES: DNA gyrase/topoisomerase IV subunit A [Spirosoma]MCK8493870.1 DNA gyrase/topoisomerase IV subunit A [Spirosoma liriopis]UHG93522.1 DNA gyrase/topoisomerase IV subunit A [Spirosoma oryzicola]
MMNEENQEPIDDEQGLPEAAFSADDAEPVEAIGPDEQPIDTVNEVLHDQTVVSGLYENYFLDYASYVILERAVPAVEDGLKPVQRRILHALKEMDDGRFNKVANVIGQTMQYHPHGDASIGEALVNIGQKELLFDTQGSWGDVRTGDGAAAPRYIEVRLSKFALDAIYNDKTTEWQLSYDGRKREPVTLPVKFPLLLAQGVEGIAVGLSTKILPHNFNELIDASIQILKDKPVQLFPDFQTGGLIDVSNYNDGHRGGKVRVRARIEEVDKKTLAIRDVPFGVTTPQLIESIVKAAELGKIRIKAPSRNVAAVVDNTARDVEILVHLQPGVSPDVSIDALYAFTDCEVSISPNACVIIGDKPHFVSVADILRVNTHQTVQLLQRELEIRRSELMERLLYSSLEKIFIENRIYRKIEECESFEAVLATIDKALKPFKKQFYRAITEDDLIRLTEIKIKRISKYDGFKAEELMRKLEQDLAETEDNLANITRYAIAYFKDLQKKYGKGRERKTEIRAFNTIAASVVAAANQKLYVDREGGFIGYGLKKDEYVSDCSDIDDIIIFRRDGKCLVTKVQDKVFVGKDIVYVSVFKKNDERKIYNLIYLDGKSGISMAKRFPVTGVTRDREYDLTMGNPKSKITYFSANDNGEAEVISINLTAQSTAKVKQFDFDFASVGIKNRGAQGNILTKYNVRKITQKTGGVSTLGGVDIWYDDHLGRLNRDERGRMLGNFDAKDSILVVYKDGQYELTSFDLTNRYEPNEIAVLMKFDPETVLSAVYYEANQKAWYVKRFKVETTSLDKKFSFIGDVKGSKNLAVTVDQYPRIELVHQVKERGPLEKMVLEPEGFIEVRGWKALGQKLPFVKVKEVKLLPPKVVTANTPKSDVQPAAVLEAGNTTETEEKESIQLGLFS